jgi:serine/threonine protein kinase
MIVRDRTPITKKEPAQPGDLQDGVLYVPLTFIRMIGGGGMGEVWEAASDDLPGHRFAVKVIASEHVRNQDVIARFFGEARAASAIDDPNIVMIHGTGRTADGRPALVMPYIEGRSLADLCEERGPLPLDAVAKILLQLASALRAAHGNHIVHRDIKLQNVMMPLSRVRSTRIRSSTSARRATPPRSRSSASASMRRPTSTPSGCWRTGCCAGERRTPPRTTCR